MVQLGFPRSEQDQLKQKLFIKFSDFFEPNKFLIEGNKYILMNQTRF